MVAITVMMRPIVQTPLDHSIAAANLDTLEMDGTFAQVYVDLQLNTKSYLGNLRYTFSNSLHHINRRKLKDLIYQSPKCC